MNAAHMKQPLNIGISTEELNVADSILKAMVSYPTAAKPPVNAERDASGRWIAPNVPMHPMSNGLVRIQFRVDQDGQAPSYQLSEFSVNKVTTAIGNDAEQKSAKPKVQTQGDRDFEAVRTHGVRSGIPRRNGNCYGSITNLPSGDTLTYDCEGNLACVSNAVSGEVSLYWYDQHGRRIAKQENGLLTLYIWDGMDIIATAHQKSAKPKVQTQGDRDFKAVRTHGVRSGIPRRNGNCYSGGTLREYYTRGIGIAGDVGSLIAETRFSGGTATTTYLHSNWRGDVVMATDAAGNVVGEYSYTTFGEQLSATGTYTPRFTFSSKERDASGLVYFGFRYYSPVLCRWISEDPIRESGSINLYQFCWNDPVNGIDPYGEFTWSEWKEIGGAFAEGFGKGIAAGVDGMIPFVDPFTGVYADDCGNVSIWTKKNDTLSGHVDCIDMLFTEQIIEFPVQIQVLASDLGALQHTDSLQLLEILRRGLPLRNAGINQKLAFGVGLAEKMLYKACRSW